MTSQGEGPQSRQTVKYGHESRGTWNQVSLCWRGPAAIYWTGLDYPSEANVGGFSLIQRVTTGSKTVLPNSKASVFAQGDVYNIGTLSELITGHFKYECIINSTICFVDYFEMF
jgi:hypothetical protein